MDGMNDMSNMNEPGTNETGMNRSLFPRGLMQPEQGYRFSLDSLLLACFARVPARGCGLDLGSGCGVVGLGVLLANPEAELTFTGLDIQQEMVECARHNSRLLGYQEQLDYVLQDVSSYRGMANQADFAVANPPYRNRERGRVSPGSSRFTARFEGEAGLEAFCRAATRVLKDKAPFFLVHLPERLEEVVRTCGEVSLTPKRVCFVHGKKDEPAKIMLLEARKNGNPGLEVAPPLVLYQSRGSQAAMTAEALAFCPFLQCNARMSQGVST